MFGFLEGDYLTVSLLPPSFSSTLASLAMSTNANKFLANLVVELVPLPTLASSDMSDSKFLANWVGVVLSLEVSGLANLLKH